MFQISLVDSRAEAVETVFSEWSSHSKSLTSHPNQEAQAASGAASWVQCLALLPLTETPAVTKSLLSLGFLKRLNTPVVNLRERARRTKRSRK